ncbi:UNVERIFIED_CONTAM: hypothetical protein GTU68_028510 [Idotea baltica]|nr:hypothetical protein [Idotea baltica]
MSFMKLQKMATAQKMVITFTVRNDSGKLIAVSAI